MGLLNLGKLEILPEYVVQDVCYAQCKREWPNSKGELEVRCPLQSDKWIEINVAKGGIWKCFRECSNCPGNHGGGILDFYMLFFDCNDRKEAYKKISESMGKDVETCNRRKSETMKSVKIEETAPPKVRDDTYRAFLEKLPLSKAHRKDLRKRGLSDADIEAMGFKSIPQNGLSMIARELCDDGCKLKGVPGFYFRKGRPQVNCHDSGYFIPYRDQNGLIIALQIRYDVNLSSAKTEEEKAALKKKRYRLFTSSGKDGGAASANVPFFGIPGKQHKSNVVYVTEGGLKAAAAQSLSNGWFTAIPGVSTYEAWRKLLEYFKEQNVETIVDAFDSDRATNSSVANAIKKLHEIAKEYGYEMKTWNWGTEQKGVDDYLLAQKIKREKEEAKSFVVSPKGFL